MKKLFLEEAYEEFKRLDHIVYITSKYCRTIDVIKSALQRVLEIFDLLIEALLYHSKEKKQIENIPKSPRLKINFLEKIYPHDEKIRKFITFYLFLREIFKARYSKREEFRRHVTLIAHFENRDAEIDIDFLETYEKVALNFYNYVKELVGK